MYSRPDDLPIRKLVGKRCLQIAIGAFEIQFRFDDEHAISVEGVWEIVDDSGRQVDHSQDNLRRETYRVHTILESPVTEVRIDPPRSFTLRFQNGYSLTIFDDGEQFESFSIQPEGVFI